MSLIQDATSAIAKTLGNKHPSKVEDNLLTLEGALDEALNINRSMVDYVDTKTLAHLLREPQRIRAVAMLLAAKGEIMEDQDKVQAMLQRSRALELHLTVVTNGDEADADEIKALAAKVPRELLSPENLAALDSL